MNPYKELFSFLRSLLQVKEIDLNKFKKHPYYQNIPYIQMEETYSYLKSLQFSNSAILKALYILLYPRSVFFSVIVEVIRRMCFFISGNILKMR